MDEVNKRWIKDFPLKTFSDSETLKPFIKNPTKRNTHSLTHIHIFIKQYLLLPPQGWYASCYAMRYSKRKSKL